MNRSELVELVGAQVGDRRLAAVTVGAVLDTVVRAVSEGQKVSLSGFGVFERTERAARTARNPATGGTVDVPATAVPRFRAGQSFKDVVSGRREAPAPATRVGPDDVGNSTVHEPAPGARRRRSPARSRADDSAAGVDPAARLEVAPPRPAPVEADWHGGKASRHREATPSGRREALGAPSGDDTERAGGRRSARDTKPSSSSTAGSSRAGASKAGSVKAEKSSKSSTRSEKSPKTTKAAKLPKGKAAKGKAARTSSKG